MPLSFVQVHKEADVLLLNAEEKNFFKYVDDLEDGALTISKDIVLDLAGKTITSDVGKVLQIAENANVKIISSQVGGEIINSSQDGKSSAVYVKNGATVTIGAKEGDEGVKVTGYAFDGSLANLSLVRAQVQAKEELEEGEENLEFWYNDYIDSNSEITVSATTQGEYWVVAPKATEEPTKFTVTFEDGLEGADEVKQVESGKTVAKPVVDPTRDHYRFDGWFLKKDDGTLEKTAYDFDNATVTGNITLVAQWTLNQYTVTFKNGYDEGVIDTYTVDALTYVTAPETAPTRDGYRFLDWYLKTGDTVADTAYNFDVKVTGNITLVAKWAPIYTVTFEDGVEDAEITVPVAQPVVSGDKASAPETATTRNGYEFLGWYLKKDDGTLEKTAYDFANTTVTSNITLVAQWEAVVVEQPSVGGSTVAPEEVFKTANSQTGIAFKGTVTETTDSDGNKLLTFGTGTNPVKVPSYYKYTMTETTVDGQLETTIELSLDETKVTPVIGATEANGDQEAIPAFKTDAGEVTIGVAETIPGLYYGIAVAKSLGNNPKFEAEGSLTLGDGNPLALTITKDANEKVKFFKVYVTDIAPPTPAK
jgi:uncharacterized repeat protein (TIGR02543 family)